MRTNIVLDDALVTEAFALTGVRTKKELVNLALRELIVQHKMRAQSMAAIGLGKPAEDAQAADVPVTPMIDAAAATGL